MDITDQLPALPLEPLQQVIQWIVSGFSQADIEQAIAHTWPRKQARPLIVQAMTRIADSADPEPAIVRGFAIEGTRTIYQRAMSMGDLQTALRALKQLVDLAG